jgi:CRISPR-associated protein Csm2
MNERRPERRQEQERAEKPALSAADLKQIIQSYDYAATQALVRSAQQWGVYLQQNKLQSSQIRTLFSSVRQIEMQWRTAAPGSPEERSAVTQLVLLKPKLEYQAGRNPEVRPLADLLSPAIDLVGENRAHFQRFVDFFEAIVAYHKDKKE